MSVHGSISANPVVTDSRKHARFTGVGAHISRKAGDTFTAYGDYIAGIQLALVPDRKIIQS